jgi:hypothetical protein
MTDLETCEGCGDAYDTDEGCQHDGHLLCASCLFACSECLAGIRQDHILETFAERYWQ